MAKGQKDGRTFNAAQQTGRTGEEYTARWLDGQGWRILDRNWRCPWGEVDIIAQKGETVAFVEVKTRTRGYLAGPLEAVGKAKQRRLLKTAWLWLERTGSTGQPRFDAAGVVMDEKGNVLSFEYIESAFDGSDVV